MKSGKTAEQLAQSIITLARSKHDYLVNTSALRFTEKQTLLFQGSGSDKEYDLTSVCLRQIGDRLSIPSKYFERMAQDAPALLALNVNHWLTTAPENRTIRTYENGKNIARAFLSDKFRKLENIDIAAHVLPKLQEAGCEVKSAEVTDTRLYIQAVIPRLQAEIAKVGDIVQSGCVISNSEVGMGSLNIEHMIHTLRCTNGMIGESIVRRSHVGRRSVGVDSEDIQELLSDATRQADDMAFWMKVKDLVANALTKERFDKVVARLNATVEVEIAKPAKTIELLKDRFSWQESEAEAILNHFIRGGSTTQYGLLNAVTRTAEDLESYDRAVEFERAGGEIMLLSASDLTKN